MSDEEVVASSFRDPRGLRLVLPMLLLEEGLLLLVLTLVVAISDAEVAVFVDFVAGWRIGGGVRGGSSFFIPESSVKSISTEA